MNNKTRRAWHRIRSDDYLYCTEAVGSYQVELDMGAFAHMDFRSDCCRRVFRYPDWRKD